MPLQRSKRIHLVRLLRLGGAGDATSGAGASDIPRLRVTGAVEFTGAGAFDGLLSLREALVDMTGGVAVAKAVAGDFVCIGVPGVEDDEAEAEAAAVRVTRGAVTNTGVAGVLVAFLAAPPVGTKAEVGSALATGAAVSGIETVEAVVVVTETGAVDGICVVLEPTTGIL